MKKIFTLLFAVGLAGSLLAQDGRHAQYRDQASNRGSSAYGYSGTSAGNYATGKNESYGVTAGGYANQITYGEVHDGRKVGGAYPVYERQRAYERESWARNRYERRRVWFPARFSRRDRW